MHHFCPHALCNQGALGQFYLFCNSLNFLAPVELTLVPCIGCQSVELTMLVPHAVCQSVELTTLKYMIGVDSDGRGPSIRPYRTWSNP